MTSDTPHPRPPCRSTILLGAAAFALLALGFAYQVAGHAALEHARSSTLPGALHALQAQLRDVPADYARGRADALFAQAMRAGTLLWTLLALVLLRRRAGAPLTLAPRERAMLWAGVVLVLAAPWLWLKFVGLAFALRGGLARPRDVMVPAARMRVAWYAVFLAAFVCAPYWTLPATWWADAGALAVLLLGGWWWAGLAAADLRVKMPAAGWGVVLLVLACATLIWPAGAVIPWMGDEDYHIMQVAFLCENMPPVWMVSLAALVAFVAFGFTRGAGQPAMVTGRQLAGWMAATATLCGMGYPHLAGTLARYPFLARWLEAAPVQLLYPVPALFYRESIVRTTSAFSVVAIVLIIVFAMRTRPRRGVALAVAVFTIPIMQYYGSLLCLEMPALVAMTLAAVRAPAFMSASAERARRDVGWLGLLTMGFVKETTLPILAAFVACRVWVFWRTRRYTRAVLLAELRLATAVLLPLVTYLVFRSSQNIFRGYPAQWKHWFDPHLWSVLIGSLWEQLGFLTIMLIAGTVALWRRGMRAMLLWWAWLAAAVLFSLGDTASFVGYSRYNLFLVPPMVAIVAYWFTNTRTAHWLIVFWLLSNQALSPLRTAGTREPGWGTPLAEVAECYYPYRDALLWLRAESPQARILSAGVDYPYYFDFYFEQLGWHPELVVTKSAPTLDAAAREAARANCTVILFQVPAAAPRIATQAHGYALTRIFVRTGSTLVIYSAAP